MIRRIYSLIILSFITLSCASHYDVCIYGGSSAVVAAAYSAAQMGKGVIVVSPDERIGGLTTCGLGYTDIGIKQAVFGVARQFYRKLGEHYGRLESWIVEPSVALEVMEEYLDHPNITLLKGYNLEKLEMGGAEIKSITASTKAGRTVRVSAPYFIDATYEGDLMARSGVSYSVGREDNAVYGETWNGVQLLERHQFPDGIDPYVEYRLPADESGEEDIYCFQQLKDCTNPLAHYSIRIAGHECIRTFDRSQLRLVGQVSGEWFHLGTYDFEKGNEGIVTMTSEPSEYPLRADALLLVKR